MPDYTQAISKKGAQNAVEEEEGKPKRRKKGSQNAVSSFRAVFRVERRISS
jgi:hypothetical protein